MTRVGLIRLAVIVAMIGALELACRTGLIRHQTIIPPSEMATSLYALLASGETPQNPKLGAAIEWLKKACDQRPFGDKEIHSQ